MFMALRHGHKTSDMHPMSHSHGGPRDAMGIPIPATPNIFGGSGSGCRRGGGQTWRLFCWAVGKVYFQIFRGPGRHGGPLQTKDTRTQVRRTAGPRKGLLYDDQKNRRLGNSFVLLDGGPDVHNKAGAGPKLMEEETCQVWLLPHWQVACNKKTKLVKRLQPVAHR